MSKRKYIVKCSRACAHSDRELFCSICSGRLCSEGKCQECGHDYSYRAEYGDDGYDAGRPFPEELRG